MIQSFTIIILLFYAVHSQFLTDDLDDERAQEIANRTYTQEQNDLQRAIFRKYDKRNRPIRNESQILEVAIHAWRDEFAVWDPAQYNGVRITMVKQWEIWVPNLRITNSVSGIAQYFEISRRSNVFIHSHGPTWSRIELYPTFSIKVGCAFDYSQYPFDEQKCALGLYVTQRMSALMLTNYFDTEPSVQLSWGSQNNKMHISDWKLQNVTAVVSYYGNGKYSDQRPVKAEYLDSTWTVLHTWIFLKRNAFCFGVILLLPSIVSFTLVTFSFLLPSSDSSIYILIADLIFLALFLEDLVSMLPPNIGGSPRIVYFCGYNFVLLMFAIALHFWLRYLAKRTDTSYGWKVHFLKLSKLRQNRWSTAKIQQENQDASVNSKDTNMWPAIVNHAKIFFFIVYTFIFALLLLFMTI